MVVGILLLLSWLPELGIHLFYSEWRIRALFSGLSLWFSGMAMGVSLQTQPFIFNAILAAVLIVRLVNILRINRIGTDASHLQHASRRTSLMVFLSGTGVLLLTFWLSNYTSINDLLLIIIAFQVCASFVLMALITHNLTKTTYRPEAKHYSDKELPSVTVAIPARNETQNLASCLESIINSDYPKLEIIALDDCSQDNTPEIIKDFAHDGVRFLKGRPPKNGWLAKNQAYQQLYEEASGEIIIFCSVHIRFDNDSLRKLVYAMLDKKRSMISILPLRSGGGLRTSLVQPMRYWWELALPRRLFNRPPCLSSCWAIKKDSLKRHGEFAAVSSSVIPEAYFARELIRDDMYGFYQSGKHMNILTVKSIEAQLDTAVRMRYPEFKKRPELAMLVWATEFLLLLGPFIFTLLVVNTLSGAYSYYWLAVIPALFLTITHYRLMSASTLSKPYIALINFPVIILTELVITALSVYRYEFSKVDWKGRNICVPVMRKYNHLPKLK